MWSLPKKLWGDRGSYHQCKFSGFLLERATALDTQEMLKQTWASADTRSDSSTQQDWGPSHQMDMPRWNWTTMNYQWRTQQKGAQWGTKGRWNSVDLIEREALRAPEGICVAKATFPRWTSQEKMLKREKQNPKIFGIRVTVQERHTHILFTSRRRTVDVSREAIFPMSVDLIRLKKSTN